MSRPEDFQVPPLETLNVTELAYIIRRQTGVVVKRSLPKERLIELIEYGTQPTPDEIAGSTTTRKELQQFIEKNWTWVNSQLPCKGPDKGKCTIYPCPEGRHADCMMSAGDQVKRGL